MSSLRVLLVPVMAVACQVIGGIEVRDEYVTPGNGAGGDDGGEAGSGSASTPGGAPGEAGTSGTPGAAGDGAGTGGTSGSGGTGGEPGGPAVCGDGVKEGDEACDDGDENGQHGQCDVSCAFVCEKECPIRVDPRIASAGDGKTWKTAFRSLQEAIDQQEEAGGGEVWVKSGTITATGTGTMLTLRSEVDVYGGFAGNEISRAERDTPTVDRATVLDANALSYPAVVGEGVQHVTFDGFVVMNATGEEGPAFRAKSTIDLTLNRVYFFDNSAVVCGGAMWLENAQIRIVGGAFEDNHSNFAGGALCSEGVTKLKIEGTRFIENHAYDRGGAIDAAGTYVPLAQPDVAISSATFIRNRTTREDVPSTGGGALCQKTGKLTIVDSDFKANSASIAKGAAVLLADVVADVHNSVFAKNEGFFAALHAEYGGPVHIVGSTFAFNDVDCPSTCSVTGDVVVLENSLSVGTDKGQAPGFGNGVTVTSSNCDLFTGGGLGATASPFGTAPLPDRDGNGVEDYLLLVYPPANISCFYQGDDAASDAAGIPWKSLTTSSNNCLDVSPVDLGRHYKPTNAKPSACE